MISFGLMSTYLYNIYSWFELKAMVYIWIVQCDDLWIIHPYHIFQTSCTDQVLFLKKAQGSGHIPLRSSVGPFFPPFISTYIVSLQGYATWWNIFQLRDMSCTRNRSIPRLMKSRDGTRFIIWASPSTTVHVNSHMAHLSNADFYVFVFMY